MRQAIPQPEKEKAEHDALGLIAEGEVREYLPLLLRHMRREGLEYMHASDFDKPHDMFVIWLKEEWPRIFIFPTIQFYPNETDFVVHYYDINGGQALLDSTQDLWFVPKVVRRLKGKLLNYLIASP